MSAIDLGRRMPWEQGGVPINWPTFLEQLKVFCEAYDWVLDYNAIEDCSCIIFARPEHRRHEPFAKHDFTDDDLPF